MQGRVRFTQAADADLERMFEFGLDRFGLRQAQRYQIDLWKALEALLTFPNMGTDQGHIDPGLRRLVHASHAIYYRAIGADILVERFLGPGQDPTREFEP